MRRDVQKARVEIETTANVELYAANAQNPEARRNVIFATGPSLEACENEILLALRDWARELGYAVNKIHETP